MAIRMKPHERRAEVLEAALRAASAIGWRRMTRDDIARIANTSPGLVSARLGTMESLRTEVMRVAVRKEVLPVIAEGVTQRHPVALKAPAELRARALASLTA